MAKDSRRILKGSAGSAKTVSSRRSVTVGKDHVTVRYHACGESHVVKISNESIIQSGRAALAKVPVIFD